MATLSRSRTSDARTRVEDYLDDKIQTAADLENVNELLAKVREQQELLKEQLAKVKLSTTDATHAANEHNASLRIRAEKFQQEQADIDHRLQVLTQSSTSDDAVKIFESRMVKLRRLEVAKGYVEILKEVNDLIEKSRESVKSDASGALSSYARLRTLLQSLSAAQPAAEGAAPHLIDQIERQTNTLYDELKANFETTFQTTLERMSWPRKEMKLLKTTVQDWSDQAGFLLDLQAPSLQVNSIEASISTLPESVVLLPLQIMAQPLAQRFQFHFYGEKSTNRLDKPEYFFSHTLDLIEQHSSFMNQLLQPILDERMRKSQDLEAVYPDAISAFISSLLPIVTAKCLSLLPQISKQPQLLSHFIHELMSFDNTLRDIWVYSPVPGAYIDWKGLTWEILNTHGYFNTWLETEKEFALSRYRKIRDSAESGNIEYDGFESNRSKPTKGAVRVNDLLETITDRYRGLTSFSQKMKFLMDVQLAIFDDYHSHLHGAMQAYLMTSHTAGRLIQGATENDTGGLKGLETLAKIFGSAEYLERKMSDWSEDLFFLELWEELQDRARRNTTIGRDLTVESVAAKTSSTITQAPDHEDDEGGALFDETAASYRRLREKSETEIIRTLETSTRNALRPLTKASTWSSLSTPNTNTVQNLSPSSALDSLLSTLSTLLSFLTSTLSPTPLSRITRHLSSTIQRDIYDLIIRNTFSAAGAMQLHRDILAIEDIIDTNTNLPGSTHRNLQKLNQVITLLNLPVKASSDRAAKIADEDNWGFDDAAENPEILEAEEEGDSSWGLWEAEKAVFASNESARRALADMGLELVSESEAREVLRRRDEIGS